MAGITHLEEFKQPALRALVDESEKDTIPSLVDRFLPTENVFSTTFAGDVIKTNNFLAGYIGEGSEPPTIDRNEMASYMGEIARFGLQDIVTYSELEALHEARNNARYQDAIDRITIRALNLVGWTRDLIQLAKSEALFKGKMANDRNKIKYGFDFGIPDENKVALTPDNDFDSADFDILGFLYEQVDHYVLTNGRSPETMLISREVLNKLLTNSQIIVEAGRPEGSIRASADDLKNVLQRFGLPTFEVLENRFYTYQDNESKKIIRNEFMPANRIVMTSSGVGKYLLGPTLENNFQPGIYLTAIDKTDPIRSVIRTIGAGFPVLENPQLVKHLDVFTP
ncbi:structural protein [Shouchella clausii KSM-K16]|uniref:Structural protein n=1 Tax=Shouchella clausii (strain KSM-K16) TaxID=66692 RepID=Q5WE42_SHOC1|nr:major capsid protein [Shouchella clausii]BAD65368.1 structural protein [Shouchella clausii KSM-K16]